ncbi:MAG: TipAS antibiotic-recognition domain-containing protein [Ruminococcus sp.]|nr:TipAS antibiotic-recognition domain-containing protein [Ruminococcus sp.]
MDKYKNEVVERFGTTDAYKEYESRTLGYTKADFQNTTEDLDLVLGKFAECKAQGNTPRFCSGSSDSYGTKGFHYTELLYLHR